MLRAAILALACALAMAGCAWRPAPAALNIPGTVPVVHIADARNTLGEYHVHSPRRGVLAARFTMNNPCENKPLLATYEWVADTVAVTLVWPGDDSQRLCPDALTPMTFAFRIRGVPAGPRWMRMQFIQTQGHRGPYRTHAPRLVNIR